MLYILSDVPLFCPEAMEISQGKGTVLPISKSVFLYSLLSIEQWPPQTRTMRISCANLRLDCEGKSWLHGCCLSHIGTVAALLGFLEVTWHDKGAHRAFLLAQMLTLGLVHRVDVELPAVEVRQASTVARHDNVLT